MADYWRYTKSHAHTHSYTHIHTYIYIHLYVSINTHKWTGIFVNNNS